MKYLLSAILLYSFSWQLLLADDLPWVDSPEGNTRFFTSLEHVCSKAMDTIGDFSPTDSIDDKDHAADPEQLGHRALEVGAESFSGYLDLRYSAPEKDQQGVSVRLAVLVDDIATIKVTREALKNKPEKVILTEEVRGGALWNIKKSFRPFSQVLEGGYKYKIELEYRNTAHRTPKSGKKDHDGVALYAYSLPVQIVEGLGTEDEYPDAWLTNEANPTPEIEVQMTSAKVEGENLIMNIEGTVYDRLSKFATNDSEKVQRVDFLWNGEIIHSINVSNGVEDGFNFEEEIVINQPLPQGYTIVAQTSPNIAGNIAWDRSSASLNVDFDQLDQNEEERGEWSPAKVYGFFDLDGSQTEDFSPYTIRINRPTSWTGYTRSTISVGSVSYPINKFTINGKVAFYPYDPRFPQEPKQFLPSAKKVPSKLVTPGFKKGAGSFRFSFLVDDQTWPDEEVRVQPGHEPQKKLFYPLFSKKKLIRSFTLLVMNKNRKNLG